jgi:hypothetical protein
VVVLVDLAGMRRHAQPHALGIGVGVVVHPQVLVETPLS